MLNQPLSQTLLRLFFLMFENILRSKILTLVTFLPMTTQKGMLFIYYNVCYSGWLNLRRRCSI